MPTVSHTSYTAETVNVDVELAPDPFTLLLTMGVGESFKLPLPQKSWDWATFLNYNFVVNWGDGSEDTITYYNQAEATHVYASADDYVVTITGLCEGWSFAWAGDYANVTEIQNWGDAGVIDWYKAFQGCTNMTITATDTPVLSTNPMLGFMFGSCTFSSGGFTAWDVSAITHMMGMFTDCASFNEDITGWDVSACVDMSFMFSSATIFNQDLSGWDVSNVVNLGSMFRSTDVFNGNIDGWDVSGCTSMIAMFYQAVAFNRDISGWDVSNVESLASMFYEAEIFNQDIGSWVTTSCTDMGGMFRGDANNGAAFNQDISGWDVSNVDDFNSMFYNSDSFNQDIGGWDVAAGTSFKYMFRGNSIVTMSFNQDISSWDIRNGTDFRLMFTDCASFSTTNYDLLLNAWSLYSGSLSVGEAIEFETQYTVVTSQAARNILTGAPNNWSITDLGGV